MTRALLLAAGDASPVQLSYSRYRLREDGVVVDVATPAGDPIRLDDTVTWPDVHAFTDLERPADIAVLLAGDDPDALRDDAALGWLESHRDRGGILAALGHAVAVLADLAIIEGRTLTAPRSRRDVIRERGGTWTGETVAVDGTVVTGTGTPALPFFMAAIRSDHAIPQDPSPATAGRAG